MRGNKALACACFPCALGRAERPAHREANQGATPPGRGWSCRPAALASPRERAAETTWLSHERGGGQGTQRLQLVGTGNGSSW